MTENMWKVADNCRLAHKKPYKIKVIKSLLPKNISKKCWKQKFEI